MLTLALASLLLGLLPAQTFDLIAIGRDSGPDAIAAAWAGAIGGLDAGLRRWLVAGLSLLVLLIGLAAGLLVNP